jgi:uncharacterized protein
MAKENIEIVRRIWEASERSDTEAVFAFYHPAIVWESHNVGPIELGGLYHGHEGIRRFFRDWLESFENYSAHAETFIETRNNVVVGYRVSGRGKGSGAEVEMRRWNVYTIRDDLVTRVEVFGTEAEAFEAAGLSEDGS